MPELPDIVNYNEALNRDFSHQVLKKVVVKSPFVLRTFEPPIQDCEGHLVTHFDRLGKRIVWHMQGGPSMVFHLMIAGRFHLKKPDILPRQKNDLAAFQFEDATLMLTEASTKKRASIHVVPKDQVQKFDPGGLDLFQCTEDTFASNVQNSGRTVKRTLTDPRILDGIGNAYSDEILWTARLSPFQRTSKLSREQLSRLYQACLEVLEKWTSRLRQKYRGKFPTKVTAFHTEMAVHGKYGQACPRCQMPIQRVQFAENEMNYCARCQTGGRVLSDRSLSRLLKEDWPKTIEELVAMEESRDGS